MTRMFAALDRRMVLKTMAATALATTLPASLVRANTQADAVLLTLADLHSPYARLPMILKTIADFKASLPDVPMALLINGDIFERGNVVALRSEGAADWVFLKALCDLMPVIINIGNHETALLDDPADFIVQATAAGAQVISNLSNPETGNFYTAVGQTLDLGGISLSMLGTATTNIYTYRKPVRDKLAFKGAPAFVAEAFDEITGNADVRLLASHSGLLADRVAFEHLPQGALAVGAHDHLDMMVQNNRFSYYHASSWGTQMGIISMHRGADGVETSIRKVQIGIGEGDAALRDVIARVKADFLTSEDRTVITELETDRTLHDSILVATEAVRQATEADLAVLGHTTFGAPLAAGPLTRYDFDAYIRFGGSLSVAEVNGATLKTILSRANQFNATTLEERTGDYIHAADLDIDPSRTYRLATNGWTAQNQKTYLGTDDLTFTEAEGLELKAVVIDHLRSLG